MGTSFSGGYRSPPLGVAIVAFLVGIFAVILILAAILLFLLLGLHAAFSLVGIGLFGLGGWVSAVVLLILGIVLLIVARGLWRTELWALVLSILVLGLLLIGNLLRGTLLTVDGVVELLLLVYLLAVNGRFR